MQFLIMLFFGFIHFWLQTEPASMSMKNLNFLFAAYTIVWLLIIGYLFNMARRQKRLARELETIKHLQQGK